MAESSLRLAPAGTVVSDAEQQQQQQHLVHPPPSLSTSSRASSRTPTARLYPQSQSRRRHPAAWRGLIEYTNSFPNQSSHMPCPTTTRNHQQHLDATDARRHFRGHERRTAAPERREEAQDGLGPGNGRWPVNQRPRRRYAHVSGCITSKDAHYYSG